MNTRTLTILLASLLLVAGCFSLPRSSYSPRRTYPITSFKDPLYFGRRYSRIAVVFDSPDLQWRYAIESKMAERLTERRVYALSGSSIFPPTRQWSQQEKLLALADNRIDGYLTFTLDSMYNRMTVIPETLATTTKVERVKKPGLLRTGDTAQYDEIETTLLTRTGGDTIRSITLDYSVRFIDRASGGVAWLGLNRITRDSYAGIDRFCDDIAGQMEHDTLMWRPDSIRTF